MSSGLDRLYERTRKKRWRDLRSAGRVPLRLVSADRDRLLAHLERVGMLKPGEIPTDAQLGAMASLVLERAISESMSPRDSDTAPRTS